MPRFEPAPEDDHSGRDFAEFPEIAAALEDLARPEPLGPDPAPVADGVADGVADDPPAGGGRLTPEEVEARLDQDGEA